MSRNFYFGGLFGILLIEEELKSIIHYPISFFAETELRATEITEKWAEDLRKTEEWQVGGVWYCLADLNSIVPAIRRNSLHLYASSIVGTKRRNGILEVDANAAKFIIQGQPTPFGLRREELKQAARLYPSKEGWEVSIHSSKVNRDLILSS